MRREQSEDGELASEWQFHHGGQEWQVHHSAVLEQKSGQHQNAEQHERDKHHESVDEVKFRLLHVEDAQDGPKTNERRRRFHHEEETEDAIAESSAP